MRVFLLLVLLSLLSACAGAGPPGPQACDVQKAAEIPVTFESGFVAAPALIGDKPVTMLVDTGAERLMVTPAAMASLSLSQDQHQRTSIQGTGGLVVSQNAVLQSFGIGGMTMLDQSATVGTLPSPEGPGLHAAGLLGADWLSDFDVELDFSHRRMALYQVHGCAPDYVPFSGAVHSARMGRYGQGLALLPVALDGHAFTAVLDSGANRTVLGQAAADRIGLTTDKLQGDQRGRAVGVDGTVRPAFLHRFEELEIAGARYPNQPVQISPLRLTMADMLLGTDWLRHNHVWINYAGRRVTFQPG